MSTQATIADFFKTSTTPGTPVVLGASTVRFNNLTLSGWKNATTLNAADVKWRPVGGTGWNIISPGVYFPVAIPAGTFLRASQIEIDVTTSGDGVHADYSSAVVYEGP